MDELIKAYEETVNETLNSIYKILKYDIGIDDPEISDRFRDFLDLSCKNITTKWSMGSKYVRTLFVKKAFPNYPIGILKLSLSVDVIVNLLDDILDEELNKQDKILYIVELFRALATYNHQRFGEDIQNSVGNYFDKIIAVAVAEDTYRKLIMNEIDSEKILNYSLQVYDSRSLDIDIFIEIPLLKLYGSLEGSVKNIIKIGRIFRTLNLIKKDIKDIEHDKKSNIETVVILLANKNGSFREYIEKLLKIYLKRANAITVNSELEDIRKNFYTMIENEKKNIERLLKNL